MDNYAVKILFISLLLSAQTAAGQRTPPLVLVDSVWENGRMISQSPWQLLRKEVQFMDKKAGYHALEEVVALPDSAFQTPKNNCCNFGYERETLWLRFRIVNQSHRRDFLIELVNPFITEITFFQVNNAGQTVDTETTGTRYPYWQRRIPHRNFMFPATVNPGDSAWFYCAIAPDYPLNMRILCWDKGYRLYEQQRFEDILMTIFFVFCILFLLFTSILITISRQYFQWYYFAYVLLTGLFIPAHLGLGFRYFWPESPHLQFIVPAVLNNLRLICGIQFFRLYFDLHKTAPRFNRLTQLTLWVFLLTALLQAVHALLPRVFVGGVLNIYFGFLMLFSLLMLGWALREMFYLRRRRASWFFVVVVLDFVGLATTSLQYLDLGYGSGDLVARGVNYLGYTTTFFVQDTVIAFFFLEMLLVFNFSVRKYLRLLDKDQRAQLRLARMKEQGLNALVLGAENERKRIARDLHDGACVNLAAINMRMDMLREDLSAQPSLAMQIAGLASDLEMTYRELRDISHDLMSKALEKKGLLAALEDLSQRMPGLEVQLYTNYPLEKISAVSQIHLYRIVQELLGNVLKHANARTVTVQLLDNQGNLLLTVEDDGQGFDPQDQAANQGIGLANIRARAEVLRGHLHLDARVGRGTFVSLELME